MKNGIITFCALLAISVCCKAQPEEEYVNANNVFKVEVPDTFSLQEMISLWKNYSKEDEDLRIEEMRKIAKSKKIKGFRTPKSEVLVWQKLKEEERNLLRTEGIWRKRPKENENEKPYWMLYLVTFNPKADSALAARTYAKLEKTFGRDSIGIPAKWVTGNVYSLYKPYRYLSTTVSYVAYTALMEKGIMVNTFEQASRGNYRKEVDGNFLQVDGHWVDNNIKYELLLFAHDMNQDRDFRKRERGTETYFGASALLYIEPTGKASIHLLKTYGELTDIQKKELEKLQEKVKALPPWRFSVLYNADGRVFPGRYLWIEYVESSGWKFRDYLLEK